MRTRKRRFSRQLTAHHVPPRSHGARFILRKTWNEHRAYHIIFGNAASFEECVEILKRYWWTPHGERHEKET